MKLKKLISGGLALGLLINSTSASFANILSEDGRYETFEGNNITIDNVLEEDKVDIEIEGNTMVNIFNYDNMVSLPESQNHVGFSLNEKEVTLNYMDSLNIDYNISWDSKDIVIKNGETYTFVADITKNTLSNRAEVYPFLWAFGEWIKGSAYVESGYVGKSIVSFKACADYKIKLLYRGYNSTLTGEISMSNIMLLKGDYYDEFTNNPSGIPEYFEGMKSVGELEDNKVEIISQNKNLIDLNIYKDVNVENGGTIEVSSDNIKIITPKTTSDSVDCYMDVGVDASKPWFMRDFAKYAIPIKPNTKYTLSYNVEVESVNNHDAYIEFRDTSYNQLKMHSHRSFNIENKITVTSPTDAKYVVIRFDNNLGGNSLAFKNIQFEESSEKTSYKQYAENKIEILLNEPLRGLPNGVKDRIIKKNGQWVVERNVREIVLDENITCIVYKHFDTITSFNVYIDDTIKNSPLDSIDVYCDKFKYEYGNYDKEQEGIAISPYVNKNLYINIDKSKIITNNTDGFKQWLSENPVTVAYELATPIYEPLNINPTTNLYLDTTHISNNSIIPAHMKLTMDRAINRAVEAIELAKTNPTISNISRARMWINLLDDSIKKDELQNEISSITNIEDLQLEKKSATSNVDVYIKSENMLLMSLSTNSITFNDYSGVEDMELNNAVNISINSSLPYQLNSYILSEIENSNKSNRIEKDLLNIKSSSDTDYKTFVDINEKLILEDDCDAGNNKSHSIDLRLKGSKAHKADVYKAVIKFEVEQK